VPQWSTANRLSANYKAMRDDVGAGTFTSHNKFSCDANGRCSLLALVAVCCHVLHSAAHGGCTNTAADTRLQAKRRQLRLTNVYLYALPRCHRSAERVIVWTRSCVPQCSCIIRNRVLSTTEDQILMHHQRSAEAVTVS
jgi:hypothetical protein